MRSPAEYLQARPLDSVHRLSLLLIVGFFLVLFLVSRCSCFGRCSLSLHLDVVPFKPYLAHLDGAVRGCGHVVWGYRTKGGVCISPPTPVALCGTVTVPPASTRWAVTVTSSGGIRQLPLLGGRGSLRVLLSCRRFAVRGEESDVHALLGS